MYGSRGLQRAGKVAGGGLPWQTDFPGAANYGIACVAGFRKQTFVEMMEGAESGAMNRPGVCEAGWSAVRLWPLNTGGFGVAESVPLLLPLY